MSFFISISILTLTNIINIVDFMSIIIMIRVFNMIAIIFFVENIVLNVKVSKFSSYLTR